MQMEMAASSISSTITSAPPSTSLSKPTMKPASTKMPKDCTMRTVSAMSRFRFCFFCIAASTAGSGLSMPMKTAKNLASRSMASSSRSSARFSDASVAKSNG